MSKKIDYNPFRPDKHFVNRIQFSAFMFLAFPKIHTPFNSESHFLSHNAFFYSIVSGFSIKK